MTDTLPNSIEKPAAVTAAGMPAPPKVFAAGSRTAWLVVFGMMLAIIANVFYTRNKLQAVREDVARRIAVQDTLMHEYKQNSQQAQDALRELQSKLSLAENKLAQSQSQQLALEQLYQNLAKNSEDWALAEIEQTLSLASQQLQLAGNVQGALVALNNADARLAKSERAQYLGLRKALAKDTARLKALPAADVSGVALRIDQLASMIETLPMLADAKAVSKKSSSNINSKLDTELNPQTNPSPNAAPETASWLNQVFSKIWLELSQLIRVRSVESPQALMLAPSEAFFVKENLKLRLFGARNALLARNEGSFKADLQTSIEILNQYFDARAPQTAAAVQLAQQIKGSTLSIELPTLADSLNAVRAIKAKSPN